VRKGLMLCAALVATLACDHAAGDESESFDTALRRAEAFVAQSDRHLHQSKLRRGMEGYGLTVVAGTKIEKFQVTVVSVLRNYLAPKRDVVLCKLAGLGLEKTGLVSGMSGSPVFVRDPADGKDKMIGAVAYGWRFPKEPMCAVQPISQMLALDGVPLPGADKAEPGEAPQPEAAAADEEFTRAVLSPAKVDFARLALPRRLRAGDDAVAGPGRLVCLRTPVMIAGAGPRTMALAVKMFAGTGMVPVRTGAVGAAEARAAADVKLQPGMAVSIPLVTGDADWAAVGTTTEVIGDYVLALGHEFYGEGPVEMPMGPAYVHTVIPSVYSSFKLGSTLKVTGALMQDEYTGVGGRIGKKARMIPMSLTVRWPRSEQKFQYQLLRHRWLTAALGSLMVADSVYVGRDLPDQHTIDYTVKVEFEKLGTYRAENRSSQHDSLDVRSDVSRPLAALMNTPLGRPVFPKRIDVTVVIRTSQETAAIQALKLDRNVYRPGDTVKGKVTLRPFRTERTTTEISIQLPKDLPDGNYELTACDGEAAAVSLRQEMPHRFTPRTVPELFAVLQELVRPRRNCLFVRLPLPEGGLAVGTNELEHLPSSLTGILTKAAPIDAKPYRRAKVVEFPSRYVLSGSAKAGFRVEKEPARQH